MIHAIRIAIIIAVALIISGLAIGGIYTVAAGSSENNPAGGAIFVVNRFTGSVNWCNAAGCRESK
ncbi:MAG TPA: hypothetical protein VGF34_19280 [Stellaceae bacterium]|jgi:hypothetical protein